MDKEIDEKMESLKRQVHLHYTNVWYPMFFEMMRREIVPESVSQRTPMRESSMELMLNEFVPPFPLKRSEDSYTVDYLNGVIFPLIMEQFPSSFEILKRNIGDQAREDLYQGLRPQILGLCQDLSFLDKLITDRVILRARGWQWLSRWSSMQIINSAIEYTIQKLVEDMILNKSVPLSIVETGSYSDETLKDLIIPARLGETKEDGKAVEMILLYIDILGRKEVLDRLVVRRDLNPYVMARVPLYQKIIDGSKLYALTVQAMEFMEKEVLRRMISLV
jgi:hypothetical protein